MLWLFLVICQNLTFSNVGKFFVCEICKHFLLIQKNIKLHNSISSSSNNSSNTFKSSYSSNSISSSSSSSFISITRSTTSSRSSSSNICIINDGSIKIYKVENISGDNW